VPLRKVSSRAPYEELNSQMTLRERIRNWLGTLLFLLALLAVAVIAEYIAPLQDMDAYLWAHPATARGLRILTIGLIVLGGVLMIGTQFVVRVGDERPLSEDEVQQEMQEAAGEERSFYRFRGRSVGSGFSDQASFHEVKEAWRQGAWFVPRWRRFFLMMLGGFLVLFGIFGLFIVIGPPWIKLISIVALLYVMLRTAWGFWRA
jgi:hypothetical protein